MTHTQHNLAFGELSDKQFERLCFALLKAEGHSEVRHWGAAGHERGCDVVSTGPDGRHWVVQAKRVQRLGPTAAVDELTKVLAEPPHPEPEVYLLAACCPLSRTTEERLRQAIADSGRSWEVKLWGRTELDSKVLSNKQLLDQFFGVQPPSTRVHIEIEADIVGYGESQRILICLALRRLFDRPTNPARIRVRPLESDP